MIITQPIVHYVRDSSGGPGFPRLCRNAIVAGERSGSCAPGIMPEADLGVFDPEGIRHKRGVPHSTDPAGDGELPGNTWHYITECEG